MISEPVSNALLVLLRALLAEEAWWDAMQLIRLFKGKMGSDVVMVESYFQDHFNGAVIGDALAALGEHTPVCIALRTDPNLFEHQLISFYVDDNGRLGRIDVKKHSYHGRGFFASDTRKPFVGIQRTVYNSFLGEAAKILSEQLKIPIQHKARKGAPTSSI